MDHRQHSNTCERFADVQLVQTDLHHTSEDSAMHNLQQYGSYAVVTHLPNPAEAPAMHSSHINADEMQSAYANSHTDDSIANNGNAAVTWYGSMEGNAECNSGAFTHEQQLGSGPWDGQQALHYTAVAKKAALGDVSRHDTPTSVFDIFNALSIVPGSPASHMTGPPTGVILLHAFNHTCNTCFPLRIRYIQSSVYLCKHSCFGSRVVHSAACMWPWSCSIAL